MRKHIARLLLVAGMATMLLSGTALAATEHEAKDAGQLYQEALDKMYGMRDYDMTVNITTKMSNGSKSSVASSELHLQMKNQLAADMQYIVNEYKSVETSLQMNQAFYAEGALYQDKNGKKTMTNVDLPEAIKVAGASWMRTLPELQLIEDIYISDQDQYGNLELTYVCETDASNQQLTEAGQQVHEYYGKVLISPEGYLLKAEIELQFDMKTAGRVISSENSMVITYKNPGQTPEFTLPSTDGYR